MTTYPDNPIVSEDGTVASIIPPVPASADLDATSADPDDDLGVADITDDEDLTGLFDPDGFDADVPGQAVVVGGDTPVVDAPVVEVGAPPTPPVELQTGLPPLPPLP